MGRWRACGMGCWGRARKPRYKLFAAARERAALTGRLSADHLQGFMRRWPCNLCNSAGRRGFPLLGKRVMSTGPPIMHRFNSIFFPLLVVLFGLCTCFFIRFIASLPALNIFKSFGIGMVLALIEVQWLRRVDEDKLKYFLLDGAIFPFFSLGIAAGFLI